MIGRLLQGFFGALLIPQGIAIMTTSFSRNMLEAAIGRQAWRLRAVETPTTEQLRQLLPQDLDDDEQGEPT